MNSLFAFRFEIARKTTGRQPRQFNVKSEALLAHPSFKQRLDYALRRSLPSSLGHVIAIDQWSVPFAATIADFKAPSASVIGREEIGTIPPDTESAIVIAGAVIESGRSLLDISRDLRSVAPRAPLLYLVGFSKTTGEPRRQSLDRTLAETLNAYPFQVIEIERMVLPLSNESNAWGAELNLLVSPTTQELLTSALRSLVETRIARLRKASEALSDDLFVSNGAGRSLVLQPGFVFWPDGVPAKPHSAADVFFTMASVLQQLRANAYQANKSSIRSNWFQQTILAPENFGRFNDDIIQASILRAAYPFEMNLADAPADSRELGRLIRRIVMASATGRGGAAAEFLIAIATQRLRLCSTDLEAVLSAEAGEVAFVKFLQRVCRAQLAAAGSNEGA